MAVLAFESSAHTLGVGIVSDGKVLANVRSMYPITDKGIVPTKVADFHSSHIASSVSRAFRDSGLSIEDIEAIGYTKGPGIGPCLSVGNIAAKALALKYGKPVIPVNHSVAHIEITKHIYGFSDPLAVYVSGGNSQILGMEDNPRHYRVYGETLDIGVGNMLDGFARLAGLSPAWGSTVAKASEGGRYIEMPYTVKGMDFAFTGLLTHAEKMLSRHSIRDVAFSLQETAFSMVCEAAERALLLTGRDSIVLSGGVAQSARLKEMLSLICKDHGISFGVAPNEYNADNGAMIALVAEKMLRSGSSFSIASCGVDQKYRIDRVRITW
ncbi:MAG: tRNA (adenosine(37)-N6)-threonylcarbamoyltransferase complex transferase subunit TsaD [Candidatus Marsarchaeota archaeon]|nr:tRNA (adenosine(37)-N6)-threonylcarbamoyltransferase complex transferase subunit TsaD [Candidatus Marsarchaeota archaeon]